MKRFIGAILLAAAAAIALCCYLRQPIVAGSWTKQTLYLWITDVWHGRTAGDRPRCLLIDDDSGTGVWALKRLCDSLHVKATFAVIPQRMDSRVSDSLRKWQTEGYGIALHGLRHQRWHDWTREMVADDIDRSLLWLSRLQFDTSAIRYVVPPHATNTRAVRQAVSDRGYSMVTGGNIVNPDTACFQLGRIFITRNTDIGWLRTVLQRAYEQRGFVILGTHSSAPEEFSPEKTAAALTLMRDMGFDY